MIPYVNCEYAKFGYASLYTPVAWHVILSKYLFITFNLYVFITWYLFIIINAGTTGRFPVDLRGQRGHQPQSERRRIPTH